MANGYEVDRERLQRHLAQLRKCAGLSAEDVANRIGITKQAISLIETHQDRPMTKLQYIGIRSVFDEECSRQKENSNLIDCYDLVFSDAEFYDKNASRIEFAINQMISDVNEYKRKKRADNRKKGGAGKKESKAIAGTALVGATLGTLAVGGIACMLFPGLLPLEGALASASSSAISAGALSTLQEGKKEGAKKRKEQEKVKRVSKNLKHPDWLDSALDSHC